MTACSFLGELCIWKSSLYQIYFHPAKFRFTVILYNKNLYLGINNAVRNTYNITDLSMLRLNFGNFGLSELLLMFLTIVYEQFV